MVTSDPIADLLSAVYNAYKAKKDIVLVSYSIPKEKIVKIMEREGFLDKIEIKGIKPAEKSIILTLKYQNRESAVNGFKRISKPSLRVFARADKIPPIRLGRGVTIISTSAGLITGHEAKKKNLGGEVICQIW